MASLKEVRGRAGVRLRTLVAAAVWPLALGYAAVAAVFALITASAPLASLSAQGVLSAALPGWLAAYQVPLVIEGRELGALPMLPTLLVALLVGRVAAALAARADARGIRETGRIAAAVVAAHAAAGLAVALLAVAPVRVDPLAGFYYPSLIAGLACVVALARRSGALVLLTDRMDDLALRGLRAGALACAALVLCGAVVVVAGLVTSFSTVTSLFTGGTGAGAGLLAVSLGYLPNAVVAGVGFAAGPGFGLGSVSVAPLGFSDGAAPAVPLLGALPAAAQPWWPALFALPLAVGLLVGWVLREAAESAVARLRPVAVAAVVVATVFAVLAGSAGGALGGGPFHPLDLRAALVSLALVAWIGVPGALVAWFAGPHPVAAGLIGPDDTTDGNATDGAIDGATADGVTADGATDGNATADAAADDPEIPDAEEQGSAKEQGSAEGPSGDDDTAGKEPAEPARSAEPGQAGQSDEDGRAAPADDGGLETGGRGAGR